MSEYIYVLSNDCYGGFGMRTEFIIELFKYYAHNPEIISEIFNFEKIKENFNLQIKIKEFDTIDKDYEEEEDEDNFNYGKYNKNIEYFMDYVIIKNNIYDIKNNTYIYISPYCTELRSNQYVIDYIFERTIKKIINNDQFTPYFYILLSFYEPKKYCTKLENNQNEQLIDITSEFENDILTYNINNNKPIKKYHKHNIIENKNKNIDDYKFYKNGIKKISENSYYKFNFDTNITKDNIYDIFEKYDVIVELPDILYFLSYDNCFYHNFIEEKQYLLWKDGFCGTCNLYDYYGNFIKTKLINNDKIIDLDS